MSGLPSAAPTETPRPMPTPNKTKPRQFRLNEETMAILDEIAAHYNLSSRAEAIRYAAKIVRDMIPRPAKRGRPKKEKP